MHDFEEIEKDYSDYGSTFEDLEMLGWFKQKTKKVYDLRTKFLDANDLLDNGNKPALIVDTTIGRRYFWYKHGALHRTTGPAIVTTREDGSIVDREYHVNDEEYTEEEYNKLFSNVDKDQRDDLTDMMTGFD